MKNFALITGASSGIGSSFAEIFAKNNINLVLVARSIDILREMKKELEKKYGVEVHILEKDLSKSEASLEVYEFTHTNNLHIEYLINNAGFWDTWVLTESDMIRNTDMIQLNITTLTHLTQYYASDMKKNASWKILNIASTAAFQPCPYMAVYGATKSYVMDFSLAVWRELMWTGVSVTTLCPGPTSTNFAKNANVWNSSLFTWNLPSSYDVALFGYQSMMQWKKIVIYGFMNWIKTQSIRFIPLSFILPVAERMMK